MRNKFLAAIFVGVACLAFGIANANDSTLNLTVPVLSVPGSPSEDSKGNPFPRPEALLDQVKFWQSVYAYWGSNQVAFHDMDYPGLIYEVIDLPGPANENYTIEQRSYIEERRTELQQKLRNLQAGYDTPSNLSQEERELLFRVIALGGKDAVLNADQRVRSQRGLRERFRRGLEISGRYDPVFRKIFSEAGLPEDLAFLPHVESSFQVSARSSAGAVGVWQFTRPTGRMFLKINPAIDERLDPIAAARGAARYLRKAYDRLGHWPFAITSYNHGMEGMSRAQKQFGTDFPRVVREYQSRSFGFASRNFYTEFLAASDIARTPETFFGHKINFEPKWTASNVVLDRKLSAPQVAKAYKISVNDLIAMNPAWSRRAGRGDIPLPLGIEVWLPHPEKAVPSMAAQTVSVGVTPPIAETSAMRSSGESLYYKVLRNETLWSISARFGMDIATLKILNNIKPEDDRVRIGQKLRVAPIDAPVAPALAPSTPREAPLAIQEADEIIHVVLKGETAFDIAANYGVSMSRLLATNDLTQRSLIHPGQRFRIPRE